MQKNRLFIYLARLDKGGVDVVASFAYGKKVYPTRVRDIKSLGLSPETATVVSKKAHEMRMTHEAFCESASSYNELVESLGKRGYKNLPTHQFTGHSRHSRVNESALVTKDSTMLRRASR